MTPSAGMKVMRVAHHAVVSAWRERERMLRAAGARIELFSARRWNEGGRDIDLTSDGDDFVHGVSTFGTHPNAFLYAPGPLWRALGAHPDLLDLHEEPFALATAEILALRALRRPRPPYLLYSAQNIDKRYPIPFRWFERWALHGAAGAYVCNAEAGEILVRKGLRGPAVLIPLGVDTEAFTPSDRTAPAAEPVVAYVGRLDAHKGVAILIRAVARRPEMTLRITGDGPELQRLRELAHDLGVADRVEFLGFAAGEDLAARYRDADVVAVPSIPTPSWLEQFCRVAVEAMAAGTPVVASRTGAIPDVVADAGILVEPGDEEALARGLGEALEPARWAGLRRRGLERAGRFTWSAVAAEQLALYRAVVGHEGVGSGERVPPQVIVVAYGEPALLDGALADLEGRYPVTIVDNSSLEATRALAERYGVTYIDAGSNLGFAAGVNVGLASLAERGLGGSDVLLLNPDARIGPAGVAEMHRVLHSAFRTGVVGATQVEPHTGDPVRVLWPSPHPARAWLEAVGLGRLNRTEDFAIGSILMLRAEAIAQVGSFDEQFFLYAEEVDWQKRARDAGWSIDLAAVDASHIGGATSTDDTHRDALFHSSLERYTRKHFGAAGWLVFRSAMIVGAGTRVLVFRGDRRRATARRLGTYLRGPIASLNGAR